MVAAEQDAGVGQREAKVVRGVAGGVDRLETPTLPGDDIAIAHRHIRSEIPVPAFFDPGLAAPASGMRAVTPGRRTRRRLQCCGRRRMVAMRVSDQDVRHTLRRETGEQGLHMLGEVGAWVDHRNLAAADHVGAGAPEGEWAGVARDDTADPRCYRFEPTVFEREFAAKRNVDGHAAKVTRDRPSATAVRVIFSAGEGDWSR